MNDIAQEREINKLVVKVDQTKTSDYVIGSILGRRSVESVIVLVLI